MKVLLIGPYGEPGTSISGGVERAIGALLPALAEHVSLVFVVPGASVDLETSIHGVWTLYLKRSRLPGFLRIWSTDAIRVRQVASTLGPDLIHLQGYASPGQLTKQPKVLTIHGFADKDVRFAKWAGFGLGSLVGGFLRLAERSARTRIDRFITLGPYSQTVMPDLSSRPQHCIPNPLDPAFLAEPFQRELTPVPRIAVVGHVSALKNTASAIKLVASVRRRGTICHLDICGGGLDTDYGVRCQNLSRSLDLEDHVIFHGNLGTDELISLLKRTSVLLIVSQQENSPMVICEANSQGVPVVAPNAFGIPYLIDTSLNGLFLPDRGASEKAAAIEEALTRNWNRAKIAANARDRFAPTPIAETTYAVYREALANTTN